MYYDNNDNVRFKIANLNLYFNQFKADTELKKQVVKHIRRQLLEPAFNLSIISRSSLYNDKPYGEDPWRTANFLQSMIDYWSDAGDTSVYAHMTTELSTYREELINTFKKIKDDLIGTT